MPRKVIPETPAERTSELSARLEGKEPDLAVLDDPIDKRMKALLADHKDMGARPEQEPSNGDITGDAYETTYPLKEKPKAKSKK